MSYYLDLSDEDKIKLASDAVRCNVPIPPVITSWLQEHSLYDRVVNPRTTHDHNTIPEPEPGAA